MPLGHKIYRLIWVAIDWIYPPHCAGCQKFGFRWCEDCQEKTIKITENQCIYCGRILQEKSRCSHCDEKILNLDQVYTWGNHAGPLRLALHKLKYQRDLGLGEELSSHLFNIVKGNEIVSDFVVPVPLGRQRQRERGYNQSALLARPFSLALGLPYRPRALQRIRETKSQVGLSKKQRKENVAGAFTARSNLVADKRILLVDDVMTTGATLDAAGQALKQAGATKIIGLALAKAVKVLF
jgi:ComF family protein